jgi:hypothetical protein
MEAKWIERINGHIDNEDNGKQERISYSQREEVQGGRKGGKRDVYCDSEGWDDSAYYTKQTILCELHREISETHQRRNTSKINQK